MEFEPSEQIPEKELNPGKEWAQRLGVFGGIAVLLFSLVFVLTMLSSGPDKIEGYAPPQTDEYYVQHLDELQSELTENVFPYVEGVQSCEEANGKLVIGIRSKYYIETRAVIIDLFDRDLFVFEEK
ncbi:MAG: hypothetical protein J6J04_02670 [Oscillospiraceae bacterium]|nr:hypothetical protein [Oscillospiraceae bacterium]